VWPQKKDAAFRRQAPEGFVLASISELEALVAKLQAAKAPSRELDREIAVVLDQLPFATAPPPAWTASLEDVLKLYRALLPGRPMELTEDPGEKRFFCTIKLYGSMPATPPYQVSRAQTAPFAVLIAMVKTLIALEIDGWV
jgi:hypothetical protein